MSKLGNLEGKKVIDYGCGRGWLTKTLANQGAEVWAFDISDEAVKKTKAMVESLNLQHRVHVDQMPAEALNYNSNMFDLIVGNAILHHVDLVASLKEMKRVLKQGGKAYFMEPLGHNLLLNLYRRMTPHLRSEDEVPMRFEQFTIIKDYFPKFEHEEYYLTVFFALFWYCMGLKNITLKTRDFLFKLDQLIFRFFPCAKKYCWYSVLCMGK
jgi:ubiquinone/menaquinone biosynthesis C-methylase UbiE